MNDKQVPIPTAEAMSFAIFIEAQVNYGIRAGMLRKIIFDSALEFAAQTREAATLLERSEQERLAKLNRALTAQNAELLARVKVLEADLELYKAYRNRVSNITGFYDLVGSDDDEDE
jgi:hypothetical protein